MVLDKGEDREDNYHKLVDTDDKTQDIEDNEIIVIN